MTRETLKNGLKRAKTSDDPVTWRPKSNFPETRNANFVTAVRNLMDYPFLFQNSKGLY